MCIPRTMAYAPPVDQDHLMMKGCPSPTPEVSESSSLALHSWERVTSEIRSSPDPTVLSELHFIGEAIWSHDYFFQQVLENYNIIFKKGYAIHRLKYANLSFKCCRTSLRCTLSGIVRFLCKSRLDLTGRIATDYGKNIGKKKITFQWHLCLLRPFANI